MNFSDTVLLERWRVQRDAQAFAELVAVLPHSKKAKIPGWSAGATTRLTCRDL